MPFIQFQIRRGLLTEWEDANPVLASGELGLEKDTNKIKIGNGFDPWLDLPYGLGQYDLQSIVETGNTSNLAINISNSTVSSNSITGALTVAGGVGIGGNLNVGANIAATSDISANTITTHVIMGNAATVTVGTSPVVIDSFPIMAFSTAKYLIRVNNGVNYHSMEAFLINDSVDVYITVYASLVNADQLISLSARINSGTVELIATGFNSGNSVKIFATRL
jgi:hypothetical protein